MRDLFSKEDRNLKIPKDKRQSNRADILADL